MPTKVEIISGFQRVATPLLFEKLIPNIKFKEIAGATIKEAYHLSREGNFVGAASYFKAVAEATEVPDLKAEMYVEVSQNLINLGKFVQAKFFLDKVLELAYSLEDENDRIYFFATYEEKNAWIADYEGLFEKSLNHLDRAQEFLEIAPPDKRTIREDNLISTITHFKGRAHVGLALQHSGEEKKSNIEKALKYFEKDLRRFENLRNEGKPHPVNEAFQYAWIARCLIEINELDIAEEAIEKAGNLFRENQETDQNTLLGYYFLLKGGLEIKKGDFKLARANFEDALESWYEKGHYPKGEASALLGMAATHWAEKKVGTAFIFALKAIREYPLILLRPTL